MTNRLKSAIEPRVVSMVERLESRFHLSLSVLGGEFPVNTTTAGDQTTPAIAADPNGDIVVVWASDGQDGSGLGIFAQRYDSSGIAQGGEIQVNTFTAGAQRLPAVAIDADGDFVVAWESAGQDGSDFGVYARRFSAAGVAQGAEFRVNVFTTGTQRDPAVAMSASGAFVVTWGSIGQDGSNEGVYARRFDALGNPLNEFRVNTYTTNNQSFSTVAMAADGDFVVAWQSYTQDGDIAGIYARRYDATGTVLGPEFLVNTYTTSNQLGPAIAMDAAGDFVIAWTSNGQDGSLLGVHAQRYNSSAVAQGSEFQVNTYTTGFQGPAAITMDADGDFLIIWNSLGQDGGGLGGVHGQHYNSAGAAQGTEFQVNTHTTGSQVFAAVSMDAVGNATVVRASAAQDGSGYGVYAQRYGESAPDTISPVVAGTFVKGRRVLPYTVHEGSVFQFVVSFSEVVSTSGGPAGVNSITNPANWQVTRNGLDLSGAISSINFTFNATTRRHEATLNLSVAYLDGNFLVVVKDVVHDGAGNRLDGNIDGTGPDSFAIPFSVTAVEPLGTEFPVNSVAADDQSAPSVAMAPAGNFVVAWQSQSQDGSGLGVYARRYTSTGATMGMVFKANSFTTGDQMNTSVAMDAAGNFVVAWQSNSQDGSDFGIYARRYDSIGAAQGSEFQVNTFTAGSQVQPEVAMDDLGNFVVAWQSYEQDGDGFGIYARRYDSFGAALGTEFLVNTVTTGVQAFPAVAMDPLGNLVVAWQSYGQDGSGYGVYGQRYNAAGVAQGGEFRVNSHTTGWQRLPSVALDSTGDFVVAFQGYGQDGDGDAVFFRRYNSAGSALGGAVQANTYTTAAQNIASVEMDSEGNFTVVWQSDGQDGSGYGIYARRYTSVGSTIGGEFAVNAFTTGIQRTASMAMNPRGDFAVAWQSNGQDGDGMGIYGQRYGLRRTPSVGSLTDSPDPVIAGNPLTLNALTATPSEGTLASVSFYRETNGLAGLQVGAGGDTFVGSDLTESLGAWSVNASTTGLASGHHTYWAQAVDEIGLIGVPGETTSTVSPSVTAAQFHYDTLPQKLRFTFNGDVSASLGVLDIHLIKIGGGSVPTLTLLPYGTDGPNVATFQMNTQLADGNYRATIFAGGVDDGIGNLSADYIFDFFILGGDANHNRRVDVHDLSILAANWLGTGKTYSQADFNYDGVVNKADLGTMALNWHQILAQPAPALSAAPVSARAPARAPVRTPVRVIDLVQT